MEPKQPAEKFLIVISSYTHGFFANDVQGNGVSLLLFDPQSKTIELKGAFNELPNVSFMEFSTSENVLFFTSEMQLGTLSSIQLNKEKFSFKVLDSLETLGIDSCHICIDPENEIVIISNYNSGSFSTYSFDKATGNLLKRLQTLELEFSEKGPVLDRQNQAHAHCATFIKTSNTIYISDLGGDKIHIYQLDPNLKQVSPLKKQPFFKVDAGLGPRHLCSSRDCKYLYSINELKPLISVFEIESEGTLKLIQTIPTIYEDTLKENYNAEIKIHPSNKFLFSSNRGYDVLSIYSINEQTGMLSFIKNHSTIGNCPRNFNFSQCGKYIVVCNQTSDNVVFFNFDKEKLELDFITQIPIRRPNRVLINKI